MLHLGDFIYEVVEYPDEVPHRYDRTVYDIGRIPDGRKVGNFHVPTTLAGYRIVYRAHIHDPDIQDARAHFPFVCIGDNHEFSWQGWQSFIKYDGKIEPAQPLRVAANQAWWEYIPSRVAKASGPGLDQFEPPAVAIAPIDSVDDRRFRRRGQQPRRGRQHDRLPRAALRQACRSDPDRLAQLRDARIPATRPETDALDSDDFPFFSRRSRWRSSTPGGLCRRQAARDDHARRQERCPISARTSPPITMLGREQKAWLKERLDAVDGDVEDLGRDQRHARHARPILRTCPPGWRRPNGRERDFATFGGGDFSGAFSERAEIYDFVRDQQTRGVRHRLGRPPQLLGRLCRPKALPPAVRARSGSRFITGSISAPGLAEAPEYGLRTSAAPLFVRKRRERAVEATINLTIKRGVRSALEYAAPATSRRRGRRPIPTSRRTWNSSTWPATAMPW